ncbi:MAG: HAD hydrolase family protein [Labilithrix sp.]|nr:HAD hydrolase family protein [Labilithrix sp.]
MAARRGERTERRAGAASSRIGDVAARASAPGPYKLLALDLDGTLLNHQGEAAEEDVVAIKRLKARGVKVTILTGRLYSGTLPSAALLGIDGPVGCADGSHVVRVSGSKTLLHHGIRGRAADRLRASLDRNDLVAFLFAEDAIVHDERGADYLPFVRTWSTDLRYAHRVTEHALWDSREGMTAVVALGREASIGRTVADIQRDETEAMQVAMFPFRRDSEHWGMVARAAGGTKGTALQWMASHYGITMEETVCVGDWLNDVPMLGCAGRSFAMGQAPAEVKEAATDVLARSIQHGGGIAEAIERAFGK